MRKIPIWKKLARYAFWQTVGVLLYIWAHGSATAERGNSLITAEICLLALPLLVWFVRDCVREVRAEMAAKDEDDEIKWG